MPDNFRPANVTNPYSDYSSRLLYAFLDGYAPQREPGELMTYSNLAAGLLGQVLTVEAKVTYEQLLHDRITGPLGMSDTVVRLTPSQEERLAPGHFADGTPTSNWDFDALVGAGGIRSSAADMVLFMQAQLQPPEGSPRKAIELAWKVHQQPISSGDFAMGLGWHVARDGSTRWHNGQTGGYHSQVLVNRRLGVGVVVLANTATTEVDVLAETLIRMLAGTNAPPREFPKSEIVTVSSRVMARYPGRYELAPGVVFTVSIEDERLMVELTGQSAFQVFPRSDTEWFYKVVEATITFQIDQNGRCNELELFQNGLRQLARRID
jgi:CubicO group peptidase (beta-lactamase class C family)